MAFEGAPWRQACKKKHQEEQSMQRGGSQEEMIEIDWKRERDAPPSRHGREKEPIKEAQSYRLPADLNKLSKALTWILRHEAQEMGLATYRYGFCVLNDVLDLEKMKELNATEKVVKAVCSNDKKRFELDSKDDQLMIRAVYGHSFRIEGGSGPAGPRNHKHFAPDTPTGVTSGVRKDCGSACSIAANMAKFSHKRTANKGKGKGPRQPPGPPPWGDRWGAAGIVALQKLPHGTRVCLVEKRNGMLSFPSPPSFGWLPGALRA